jgi:hypothetical protein
MTPNSANRTASDGARHDRRRRAGRAAVAGLRGASPAARRYINQAVLRGRRWLARSGRTREHFEISGGGFVATGPDDESVAKMVEWVRYRVAFYASTPAYWPVLTVHGLQELGAKLNVMSKAGQWDRMAAEVSDEVVRLFAAVGTHRDLAKEIEQRFGGVADGGTVRRVRRASEIPPDLIRIFAGFRAFTGYRTDW